MFLVLSPRCSNSEINFETRQTWWNALYDCVEMVAMVRKSAVILVACYNSDADAADASIALCTVHWAILCQPRVIFEIPVEIEIENTTSAICRWIAYYQRSANNIQNIRHGSHSKERLFVQLPGFPVTSVSLSSQLFFENRTCLHKWWLHGKRFLQIWKQLHVICVQRTINMPHVDCLIFKWKICLFKFYFHYNSLTFANLFDST